MVDPQKGYIERMLAWASDILASRREANASKTKRHYNPIIYLIAGALAAIAATRISCRDVGSVSRETVGAFKDRPTLEIPLGPQLEDYDPDLAKDLKEYSVTLTYCGLGGRNPTKALIPDPNGQLQDIGQLAITMKDPTDPNKTIKVTGSDIADLFEKTRGQRPYVGVGIEQYERPATPVTPGI